jgi:ribosomal protein S18 acetylase RimI-like enzyme
MLRRVAGRAGCRVRGNIHRVTVQVEVLGKVTGEVVDAFARLIPQLSRSAAPPGQAELEAIAASPADTVLLARSGGVIVGTMTLVMFPIPTGLRAWIEDVVVDEAARGQGIAETMMREALSIASEAGARTVDLTSRASRAAAGRLYERLGFAIRETRLYRYTDQDR